MQFVVHGMQSNYYSFTEPRKRISINNSLREKVSAVYLNNLTSF